MMSWYDDDDGPGEWETLAGVLKRIYDQNHRNFNRDVETPEGRKYLQAVVHIMQSGFGLNIGYSFKWWGYPHSSDLFSGYLTVYTEYTRKLRNLPEIEKIHPNVVERFDRFLAFIEEAGDDPSYMMLISGIVHVRRCYDYGGVDDIRKTLARGMNPTERFDEAIELCRKYGIVEEV
jgi:hypothetical protein